MRKRIGHPLLTFLLCGALAIGLWSPVQAQARYEGLDILFLVDQSGSLSGIGTSRAATDPQGIRFDALRYALNWLGIFHAQQTSLGNDLEVNAAFVYFGDDTAAINFNTQQNPRWASIDPATLSAWSNDLGTLVDTIQPDEDSLGNTNFRAAFNTALNTFDQLESNNPNRGRRLQVVLLLTDGAPCAPSDTNWGRSDNSLACLVQGDKDEHIRLLQGSLNSQFRNPNQRIFVVAIDENDAYWFRYDDAWTEITNGNATRIESAEQIGSEFNRILSGLGAELIDERVSDFVRLGVDIALADRPDTVIVPEQYETFYISPYQEQLTLSLFKSASGVRLFAIDPNGNTVNEDADNVTVDGETTPIEIWQIDNPIPGQWQFAAGTSTGQPGRVQVDAGASLIADLYRADFTEVGATDARMYRPTRVEVRAIDRNGDLMPDYNDPTYDLAGIVEISSPNGVLMRTTLQNEPSREGVFYEIGRASCRERV